MYNWITHTKKSSTFWNHLLSPIMLILWLWKVGWWGRPWAHLTRGWSRVSGVQPFFPSAPAHTPGMCYSLPGWVSPSPCWLQVSKIMRRETFSPTSSARTSIATLLGVKGHQLGGTCGWWLGEEPGLLWSRGIYTRAQRFCKTQHLSLKIVRSSEPVF